MERTENRDLVFQAAVGGPVLVTAAIAVLFGVFEAGSVWQIIATMPEFFWELSLGIWLIVKGFNPSAAILSEPDTTDVNGRGERKVELGPNRAYVMTEGSGAQMLQAMTLGPIMSITGSKTMGYLSMKLLL